jgi:VIT1/CCC1 family predicted Fe2+/Mn2+ transporter
LDDAPLNILPEDRAHFHQSILTLSRHGDPVRARLRRRDLWAALVVFVLVSATSVPAVIPFLLLEDSNLALRLSNLILLVLLFLVGFWWAHYTDIRPWAVGLTVMLLGIALVLVAIVLGG